jgi:hypothetical protein
MKSLDQTKAHVATLAALLVFLDLSRVNAGIIDLLRGEQAGPVPQRVAFVGSARVKQVQGDVLRLTGRDQWAPLKEGDELKPGDIVQSRSGSAVLSMTESESFVKVTPNTSCRLVPLQDGWDPAVLSGQEEREGFIVRSCRGQAYVASSGRDWTPVTVNTVLKRGTQVRTESGAFIDLFHTESQRATRIIGSVEVKLDERVLAERVHSPPTFAAARR